MYLGVTLIPLIPKQDYINYPLVICKSLLLKPLPIEIVDLPNLKMVIFQFVNCSFTSNHWQLVGWRMNPDFPEQKKSPVNVSYPIDRWLCWWGWWGWWLNYAIIISNYGYQWRSGMILQLGSGEGSERSYGDTHIPPKSMESQGASNWVSQPYDRSRWADPVVRCCKLMLEGYVLRHVYVYAHPTSVQLWKFIVSLFIFTIFLPT
jgi:hypothetical protein